LTALYFGDYWDVPALHGAIRHLTPFGVPCLYCEHPIEDDDRGFMRPVFTTSDRGAEFRPAHRGCDLAAVMGHHYGVCRCTGYEDLWACNVALEERGVFKLADRIGARRYN